MTKKEFSERLTGSLAAFFRGKSDTTKMFRVGNKIIRHFREVFELDFELTGEELGEIVQAAKLQVRIMKGHN